MEGNVCQLAAKSLNHVKTILMPLALTVSYGALAARASVVEVGSYDAPAALWRQKGLAKPLASAEQSRSNDARSRFWVT